MTPSPIPDQQQVGWNAGYLAGEAERLALATECDRLRWELNELRIHITNARESITYEVNHWLLR